MNTQTKEFIVEKDRGVYVSRRFAITNRDNYHISDALILTEADEIFLGIAHRYDGTLGHTKFDAYTQTGFLELLTVPFEKKRIKNAFGENFLIIKVELPAKLNQGGAK